jgi:hypothetical protein
MAKLITKTKDKTIKAKELKWFRTLLQKIGRGETPIDNVRVSYKGKSDWVKVSFWCKVKRIDKVKGHGRN